MNPALRRSGVALLVLAALALGHAVSTAWPLDDRLSAPFVRAGGTGEEVALRYARVTADPPIGSMVADVTGALLTTPGVWVLVPVMVMAEGEPRRLEYAAVIGSDGRTYEARGMRSQLALGRATPGIPHYGAVLVELPPEAAVGAHLRLALDVWDQRADNMADIDLGITASDVEDWQGTDDPVRLPNPTDIPPEA